VSGGDRCWYRRSTAEKISATRDYNNDLDSDNDDDNNNTIIIIIIIIIIIQNDMHY
jgi:hypothetical protein